MKYLIKVLYRDYHNKEVVVLGMIPTNIQMNAEDCLLRARHLFGPLIKDPNCIYAFQSNGEGE